MVGLFGGVKDREVMVLRHLEWDIILKFHLLADLLDVSDQTLP